MWTEELITAYQGAIKSLEESVLLAHPSKNARRCAFTDASEEHWGVVITQVEKESADAPVTVL